MSDWETATEALDEARDNYRRFQESMEVLGSEMRRIDIGVWHRIDAYPGWDGTRDVGAGKDMMGWLEEVAERLGVGADRYEDDLPPDLNPEGDPTRNGAFG